MRPATRRSLRSRTCSSSRCASRTTPSASAATSSRCCSRRRPRRTRDRSSRAWRLCSRSSTPAESRGRPTSARASAPRLAQRTRAIRRRSSASPTRRSTTRSGVASCCASSRAPRASALTFAYDRAVQKVVLSELDSGERIISERVASVRSVSLGFWIDVGSRDERNDRAGVSHFIEHLLFKGSRRFDAQEIAETFDAMGAELNAATSRENTVVFARVPDRHVEAALDVMADTVFAPSFAEVDQERDVVLEEIAMYEDTPQELVHDLFSEAVFGTHALGRPVIGTREVISTVSRRALAAYHRSMYVGGNIVIAAAGNLEHNAIVDLIQRAQRRPHHAPAKGV